jgi:hypothetical protein
MFNILGLASRYTIQRIIYPGKLAGFQYRTGFASQTAGGNKGVMKCAFGIADGEAQTSPSKLPSNLNSQDHIVDRAVFGKAEQGNILCVGVCMHYEFPSRNERSE